MYSEALKNGKCQYCKYGEPTMYYGLRCHRNAPQVSYQGSGERAHFPKVAADDWCGEYVQKDIKEIPHINVFGDFEIGEKGSGHIARGIDTIKTESGDLFIDLNRENRYGQYAVDSGYYVIPRGKWRQVEREIAKDRVEVIWDKAWPPVSEEEREWLEAQPVGREFGSEDSDSKLENEDGEAALKAGSYNYAKPERNTRAKAAYEELVKENIEERKRQENETPAFNEKNFEIVEDDSEAEALLKAIEELPNQIEQGVKESMQALGIQEQEKKIDKRVQTIREIFSDKVLRTTDVDKVDDLKGNDLLGDE